MGATALALASGNTFSRAHPQPDPFWQDELDRLFEPGGQLQWLHLYWEEGYPWQPVGRWMIGKVTPPEFVPDWYHEWLQGPNPAELGHYDFKNDRWVSNGPLISRRQWRFYREYAFMKGCLLEPYWVVQGSRGGHKYRWSKAERTISRVKGGPSRPAAPGELPYATPDRRTFAMLAQKDRIRMHLSTLDYIERGRGNDLALTEDELSKTLEMREEVWGWLQAQCEEAAEIASSQAAKEMWDTAPYDPDGERKTREGLAELEEAYLTGEI